MDQTELKNKIGEYYAKLPENMQKIFSSMSWMQVLEEISITFTLNEEQKTILGTETTLALLRIISLEEYQNTIRTDLKIDKKIIDEITTKIDTEIFKNIYPQLLNTSTENTTSIVNNSPLDERFSSLPDNVKNAIIQSDYQNKLYTIATKYKLPIYKMAELENLTIKIMTGVKSPKEYEADLMVGMGLSDEKMKDMIIDINETVLKNIRERMKNPSLENKIDEMEIPLPPYKIKNLKEDVPQKASGIYASAGIEIIHESNKQEKESDEIEVTKKEDSILEKSGIDMIQEKKNTETSHIIPSAQTQRETLAGIEHPEDVATSIIKDKLGGTIIGTVTKTNYSLPKINTQTPIVNTTRETTNRPAKIHDPYHEAIE